MTTAKQPYFMQNRSWYKTPEDEGRPDMFFEDGRGYHICDNAPKEAKASYREFYEMIEAKFELDWT